MSIREGATESSFLSEKTYLTVYIDGDYELDGQLMRKVEEKKVDFSSRIENNFSFNTSFIVNTKSTFSINKLVILSI
jgi:hypothetical protein